MTTWLLISSSSSCVLCGDHVQAIEDGRWGPGIPQAGVLELSWGCSQWRRKQYQKPTVRGLCCFALTSWEITWPPRMPRASRTGVFAVTSNAFLRRQPDSFTNHAILKDQQHGIEWRHFVSLSFTPSATVTASSRCICLFLAGGSLVGHVHGITYSLPLPP